MRIKHEKKTNGKAVNVLLNVFLVLFAVVFVVAAYVFITSSAEYKKANEEYAALSEFAVKVPTPDVLLPGLSVDHDELKAINDRYVGWLDIPDTKISYPMVYARDYIEYLYTTFEGENNNSGSVFTDFRCATDFSSRNTIIYAHRMNDGSMFGTLKDYFDEEYFKANNRIYIYTEKGVRVYEVFSVYYAISADESYQVDFETEEEYSDWLDYVVRSSAVKSECDPHESDSVIMLSTCKGGDNEDRVVVFAALMSQEEQI
ncbi:MAG: class B sortase [Ruminococcaceae bacterium]|nr:class B sortase [Oscillospiraceae bacterium]